MKELKCIIIEDEPIAAGIIQDYIKMIPSLIFEGAFTDPLDALSYLRSHEVDVLFLDLQMPHLGGFDLLDVLSRKYQVIITTAYHQYALEGFEKAVVDYLLKPIEFERFVKAINKLNFKNILQDETESSRPFKFFNVNKAKVKVYYDEILYIESLKDYVRIFTKDKSIVTRYSLSEMEKEMILFGGLRIHKSYIINVHKISSFNAQGVVIHGKELPIGRQFKESVIAFFEKT
ncbi:MAG TPA: LytTR family DNA-binding domain-containing protein [Saprospiraceae bacterium]|nr:LytTR family DNA-binding domain-containing protein [Saprospiraceae bacterium]